MGYFDVNEIRFRELGHIYYIKKESFEQDSSSVELSKAMSALSVFSPQLSRCENEYILYIITCPPWNFLSKERY